MAHIAGLVAAGLHPSPFPHADIVTTTTHKTLRGGRGGLVFSREELPPEVDKADFPTVKTSLGAQIDKAVFPGAQGGPLLHVIAGKAVGLLLAQGEDFKRDQQRTVENAATLASALAERGARVVSGGTDNHLMLVDVFSKGLTGKVAEAALGKAGITVNKNAIPFDKNPPMVASGIRVGTPAVTSRGMREPEMDLIAEYISRALASPENDGVLGSIKVEVEGLCRKFPLYPEA
jgi:glycine hydroxymethyltransferase